MGYNHILMLSVMPRSNITSDELIYCSNKKYYGPGFFLLSRSAQYFSIDRGILYSIDHSSVFKTADFFNCRLLSLTSRIILR